MPLFSNKFTPKKSTSRKADISVLSKESDREKILQELGINVAPINIKLGDQETSFENGEWLPESGPVSGTHRENRRLKKYVHKLEEENNLLKLKLEVLLDMLTQTTAEFHLQSKALEQLKPASINHKR